jgi:hypothetical protein
MKDLINEVEKYGKEMYSYPVHEDVFNTGEDEPFFESVYAGEAIVYQYAEKEYEIITYNENSEKYDEGTKRIKQLK